MKLALRRYGLPPIIALALYSLVYLLVGRGSNFVNLGFIVCILFAYCLRLVDDIKDFEKDLHAGKVLFSLRTLYIILAHLLFGAVILLLIFKLYLILIPFLLLMVLLSFKNKIGNFIKPFLLSATVLTVGVSLFKFDFSLVILAVICFVTDAVLVFVGRNK